MISSANIKFLSFTFGYTILLKFIIVCGNRVRSGYDFFLNWHNYTGSVFINHIHFLSGLQCYLSHKPYL